jgi:DUF1009 family protein
MQKLGLIAGNRAYPLLFAKEAKEKGVYLVAVAFKGETSRFLKHYVDEIYWVEVGQLEEFIEIFKSKDISSAVMVGQVTPMRLFRKHKLDKTAAKILSSVDQMSAETIFTKIADELEKEGVSLKDARLFLEKYLANHGPINSLYVNDLEMQDINFGKEIAKRIAGYNIGQTIVVKNKTVVAVEAIEGTDNTIRRGGRIGRGNVVVIKVSKPNQDMRFDVPVIGPNTVKVLRRAGRGVLALESGQVLILEKEKTVKLADKYGVKIIGI